MIRFRDTIAFNLFMLFLAVCCYLAVPNVSGFIAFALIAIVAALVTGILTSKANYHRYGHDSSTQHSE